MKILMMKKYYAIFALIFICGCANADRNIEVGDLLDYVDSGEIHKVESVIRCNDYANQVINPSIYRAKISAARASLAENPSARMANLVKRDLRQMEDKILPLDDEAYNPADTSIVCYVTSTSGSRSGREYVKGFMFSQFSIDHFKLTN